MCRPYFKTHPDLLLEEVSEETGLPSDEIGKERTSRARFFPHLVTQLVQHDVSHNLWTPSISHLHHTRDNPEVISKRSRVIPDGASTEEPIPRIIRLIAKAIRVVRRPPINPSLIAPLIRLTVLSSAARDMIAWYQFAAHPWSADEDPSGYLGQRMVMQIRYFLINQVKELKPISLDFVDILSLCQLDSSSCLEGHLTEP